MKLLKFTRIYYLNEDVTNPNCHICGKECSPYRVEDDELLTLGNNYSYFKDLMTQAELFYNNYFGKGLHLIFLCKSCKDKDLEDLRRINIQKNTNNEDII